MKAICRTGQERGALFGDGGGKVEGGYTSGRRRPYWTLEVMREVYGHRPDGRVAEYVQPRYLGAPLSN